MADEKKVRAPSSVVFSGKPAGKASFSAYFLRDLYAQGRIDDALIKSVLLENGFTGDDVEGAMEAITATDGAMIAGSRQIALDALAEVIAAHN
ncbi:hypothetical protein [Pseudooceanicola atlanticus]|uniref:hypothetical protein n=1 Tax=Pseudooceanicola atlanticus TaxID=1461694 RepID=UPI0009DDB172|nr:hypothetical protein [Pseudooceanicola atlanticus]